MPQSPESQAALDAAVQEFAAANGYQGVLTSFTLVGHLAGFDGDGASTSSYLIGYMGGEQAEHITFGLLEVVRQIIVCQHDRYRSDG